MKEKKIQYSTYLNRFRINPDNREVKLPKHKKLLESMKKHGFLSCYPIICTIEGNQRGIGNKTILHIKDGQHRYECAKILKLGVWYVILDKDINFDVAELNCTPRVWNGWDFVNYFSNHGSEEQSRHYQKLIDFLDEHKDTSHLTYATALLNAEKDTLSPTAAQVARDNGSFKVVNEEGAYETQSLFNQFRVFAPSMPSRHVSVFHTLLRLDLKSDRGNPFSADRLIKRAKGIRRKLKNIPKDPVELVKIIEEVYNHRSQDELSILYPMKKVLKRGNVPKYHPE